MAENAKNAMGMLFANDRIALSIDDCIAIFKAAYR
jgi:alcohol dehydrogenase